MVRTRNAIGGVGLFLIALPLLAHLFWPNPKNRFALPAGITNVPSYNYATAPPIRSWRDDRILRRANEDSLAFASRALIAVHAATYHCDYDSYAQSWWTELSHLLGLFDASQGTLSLETFRCGFCHQRSFIFATALRNGGLSDATLYGLSGHVVAIFLVDGKRYAADPDYGVKPFILPDTPPEIRKSTLEAYSTTIASYGDTLPPIMADYYSSVEDNAFYNFENLSEISEGQRRVLQWQFPMELASVLIGIALIAKALVRFQRAPDLAAD